VREGPVADRIACAVVPALPLQVLLRARSWTGTPAAVVDRDSPAGRVLWASPEAVRGGVLPGLRYAAALALCRDLRAAEVPAREIAAEVARLATVLRRFSPAVEPSTEEPGVFWLSARGLLPLYASLAAWRGDLLDALRGGGLVVRAAVGFTRFGSFAAARTAREPGVFEDRGAEREAALDAPLRLLGVPPADRDALERLGAFRVRDLLALPAHGVGIRFGPETARLRALATGDLPDPLEPVAGEEPVRARAILDHAEADAGRLLRIVESLLDPLVESLSAGNRAAEEIEVRLRLDDGTGATLSVRPAAPTRDGPHLRELARLRLEAARLRAGVVEAEVEIRAVPGVPGAGRLFADREGRDGAAAGRALARLRAEFGPAAVARARPRDGHLPEASFAWGPVPGVLPPPRAAGGAGRSGDGSLRPLVRRLHDRPRPVGAPGAGRDDSGGWNPGGMREGAATDRAGPFLLAGGWWAREVRREYHWLETRRGSVLWAFHDRRRRRWFLQGRLE